MHAPTDSDDGCLLRARQDAEIKLYMWSVWKRCKHAGYVTAYGEWEATRKAEENYGKETFIVRVAEAKNDGPAAPAGQ